MINLTHYMFDAERLLSELQRHRNIVRRAELGAYVGLKSNQEYLAQTIVARQFFYQKNRVKHSKYVFAVMI